MELSKDSQWQVVNIVMAGTVGSCNDGQNLDWQGVVTTNSPVEPSATGIKIKRSRGKLALNQATKTSYKVIKLAHKQNENLRKYVLNYQAIKAVR